MVESLNLVMILILEGLCVTVSGDMSCSVEVNYIFIRVLVEQYM